MVRFWRFLSLLLTGLALGLTWAHVLELPQKLHYDPQLYSAVNTTLYRYFAVIGAPVSLAAIVATVVLTILVRDRPTILLWTGAATLLLVLWLASWFLIVAPVNNDVDDLLASAPEAVPELWLRLRPRWEYGHAIGFILELAAFCLLIISVVVDTPHGVVRGSAPRGRRVR
jgi:hypothetical protein